LLGLRVGWGWRRYIAPQVEHGRLARRKNILIGKGEALLLVRLWNLALQGLLKDD
jgi:type II secretory pathway component PulM